MRFWGCFCKQKGVLRNNEGQGRGEGKNSHHDPAEEQRGTSEHTCACGTVQAKEHERIDNKKRLEFSALSCPRIRCPLEPAAGTLSGIWNFAKPEAFLESVPIFDDFEANAGTGRQNRGPPTAKMPGNLTNKMMVASPPLWNAQINKAEGPHPANLLLGDP